MIRSISANKSSFRKVSFGDGLNVVLATRTKRSKEKDSTNGLGKSTLLDILHFCLGGDKEGALSVAKLDDWKFTVTMDIGNNTYSISRSTAKYSKIWVAGDFSDWQIQPKDADGKQSFDITAWRKALGSMMYGIDPNQNVRYGPTFRSLVSYFARRDTPGGYGNGPFQHNSHQRVWDSQVNNAYLLGLNWNLASQKQKLRDRETALNMIKKKSVEITAGDTLGGEAELRAISIRLADEIDAEKERISNFRIHETYHRLEADADKMTKEMHEMLNQNVVDKRILELYRASMVEETDADPEQVSQIYKDFGLAFPDMVVKRLEDVRQFHKNIVRNRKDYLGSEIDRLDHAVRRRERDINDIGDKKSRIMNILKTHGALDEFLRIQENHQAKIAELEGVENRLKILREVGDERAALALDSARLLQTTKSDLAEREARWAEAIRTFNSYSRSLYDTPGTLTIGAFSSGYKFNVYIERSDSHGYQNMKIFCYDLMLARLWARKQASPGFLVHDSIMFADVDKRQVAHAIQLADAESREHKFQYICMMNSDSIPHEEFDPEFDFDSHVSITLTDETERGSLLGIRF